MKKFTFLLLTTVLLVTDNLTAQLYEYSDEIYGYAAYVNPNLSADKLRRVKGAHGGGDACPIGFTSRNFTTEETWASNQSSVVLKLIPNPGVTMNITSISANLRITDAGPIYVRYAYSIDGGMTWVDAGFDFTPTIASCIDASVTYAEWDCPDFSSAEFIYFRIYGYSAVETYGRLNITDLHVNGSLTMDDLDGDGYGAFIDCNDDDAAIYPGAAEICNDIDEDCDGISDEVEVSIEPAGITYLCNHETVELIGTPGYLEYQWYKNGSPIPFTTPNITMENNGYYQLWATNGDCSAFSEVKEIVVYPLPFANIYYPDGLDLCFVEDTLKLKASYDELYAWQWYKDGSPIGGEVWYKLPVTSEGNYYCEVTNVYGCSRVTEEVTIIESCRMSANEEAMPETLYAYPNPATNNITLSLETNSGLTETGAVRIVSMNGEEIMFFNVTIDNGRIDQVIDISELPAGVYYAQIMGVSTQYGVQFSVVH